MTQPPKKTNHGHPPEHFQLISEYLKHLTTLSTGSIILLAAFLEKIFRQPSWKPLVAVAPGSFMLSVLAAVVTFTMLIDTSANPEGEWGELKTNMWALSFLIVWLGFLGGVLAMTTFAIRNLL